jgi:PadR family transcriptional regulator
MGRPTDAEGPAGIPASALALDGPCCPARQSLHTEVLLTFRPPLGELEHLILFLVANSHHTSGLTAPVMHGLLQRLGYSIRAGAVYVILGRLARKQFLRSSWSKPLGKRGGRSTRLYVITVAGTRVLKVAEARRRKLSNIVAAVRHQGGID